VPAVVDAISRLRHVRIVGVTSFPCVRYKHRPDEKPDVAPNLHTILRTAITLRELGIAVKQINAPGNTSAMIMPLLAQFGATHVEPSHGLLGTTPNHAFNGTLPERPAYAYGGGLFHDDYITGSAVGALVGSNWDEARNNGVEYLQDVQQIIDYHVELRPGNRCKIGDTALLGYRTQMQMTRSYIAPVSGVSGNQEVKLHYLFDHANTALDEHFDPVDPAKVRSHIDQVVAMYA
jgi:predicted amino acid racemase